MSLYINIILMEGILHPVICKVFIHSLGGFLAGYLNHSFPGCGSFHPVTESPSHQSPWASQRPNFLRMLGLMQNGSTTEAPKTSTTGRMSRDGRGWINGERIKGATFEAYWGFNPRILKIGQVYPWRWAILRNFIWNHWCSGADGCF